MTHIGKKLGLLLTVAGVWLAGAPVAQAHENDSGTACHAYNAGEVTDIDYLARGVRNMASSPRYVICPVDFVPTADGSITVYVDGQHTIAATTSCTLFSHNYDGTMLGSTSDSRQDVNGSWEMTLSLPAGQASVWSYLSVLCYIPGNGTGLILGTTAMP